MVWVCAGGEQTGGSCESGLSVLEVGWGLGLPGSLAMALLPGQCWTELPASMFFQGIHGAEVADTTGPSGPIKWAQESWL